ERCRFVAKPVSTFTRAFAERLQRGRLRPAVIFESPREGCEAVVLDDVFGGIRPATAVYVSCNLETLARDLQLIVRQGYTIESIQPVDMFPHTPHVETVVVMSR